MAEKNEEFFKVKIYKIKYFIIMYLIKIKDKHEVDLNLLKNEFDIVNNKKLVLKEELSKIEKEMEEQEVLLCLDFCILYIVLGFLSKKN